MKNSSFLWGGGGIDFHSVSNECAVGIPPGKSLQKNVWNRVESACIKEPLGVTSNYLKKL